MLENPLKLIADTQEVVELLLHLPKLVFRDSSNPVARNLTTITHAQDGRQLRKRKAYLQRILD